MIIWITHEQAWWCQRLVPCSQVMSMNFLMGSKYLLGRWFRKMPTFNITGFVGWISVLHTPMVKEDAVGNLCRPSHTFV